MEDKYVKIRCSVRSNLFIRLGELAGTVYNLQERYDFTKFFCMVTDKEVTEYMESHITTQLTYYEACCEYWLNIMFGWTEYDEEKYAELLEMNIPDLYDKLSLAYKKYQEKEKLESILEDFK